MLPLLLSLPFLLGQVVGDPGDSSTPFPSLPSTISEDNPLLPSRRTLESALFSFIDGAIKSGQIELAKSAFRTQLDVIKKIRPEQYDKYKKMGVEALAAEAVLKQAQLAATAPRSGNRFIDMLSDNGIPIGSSIKGVEEAMRTQRSLENSDPSEQIAKAVFDKFQTQILPGIVANLVAGRNPFKVPPRPPGGSVPTLRQPSPPFVQGQSLPYEGASYSSLREAAELRRSPSPSLYTRLSSSPRLSSLLRSPRLMADMGVFSHRDDPLDAKSSLLLGLFDEEEDDSGAVEMRRSPTASPHLLTLRSSLLASLASSPEVREQLNRMRIRSDRVDELLRPRQLSFPSSKTTGFVRPRSVPRRPRKMLPLIIASQRQLRRSPSMASPRGPIPSRVIDNLLNNPNIAPLFLDGSLLPRLAGRPMVSDEAKGRSRPVTLLTHPRFAPSGGERDGRVVQVVEERPPSPLLALPTGRYTRIRWTGAKENEVPGVGGRFIVPSFDPTQPALNTAYSTQGRFRDEWDTTWKIPNAWESGDEVRFTMKQRRQRFMGGDGNADMPAAGF